MRTFTTVAIVTALAGIAVVGGATAASAGDPGSSVAVGATAGTDPTVDDPTVGVVKHDTRAYLQPRFTSSFVQAIPGDTLVAVQCSTAGEKVSGNPEWVRVALHGKLGFVPAGAVHTSPQIPSCALG